MATDTITFRASDGLDAQLQAAAARLDSNVSEVVRDTLRRGLAYVTREACPYFTSTAPAADRPSIVQDAARVALFGTTTDPDVRDRWARFQRWQDDPVVLDAAAEFVVSSGNASQVIPPGYAAAFLPRTVGRPMYAAAHRVPLRRDAPATPMSLPAGTGAVTGGGLGAAVLNVGGSDITASALPLGVEGTNPTESTLTVGAAKTVSPRRVSGVYRLTREVLDAANPSLDDVVLTLLAAEFNRASEGVVYAELNGANGQAGTITAGQVPSGAWVSSVTNATLPGILRQLAARHPFRHPAQQKITHLLFSADGADGLVGDPASTTDVEPLPTTDRWLSDVAIDAAPGMTGATANDAAVFGLAADDLWCWESEVLQLRWEERAGPTFIDLCLTSYFAARLLRPSGLAAVRLSD